MQTNQGVWLSSLILSGLITASGCTDQQGKGYGPMAGDDPDRTIQEPLTDVPSKQVTTKLAQQPDPINAADGDRSADEEKQATDLQDPVKDASEDSNRVSPIDDAIKKLDSQEVVDLREPQVVAPQEVHAELLPLIEEGWVRLHPGYEVWLDNRNHQVIVGGRISLRDGLLEMFACPMGTKEHESVVATVSDAEIVHFGLLGVGAIKGITAYWTEETGVVTARGPVCEITIVWREGEETKKPTPRNS